MFIQRHMYISIIIHFVFMSCPPWPLAPAASGYPLPLPSPSPQVAAPAAGAVEVVTEMVRREAESRGAPMTGSWQPLPRPQAVAYEGGIFCGGGF